MNCKNCIGTGIIKGLGEYRAVCPMCNGLGRSVNIPRKDKDQIDYRRKKISEKKGERANEKKN